MHAFSAPERFCGWERLPANRNSLRTVSWALGAAGDEMTNVLQRRRVFSRRFTPALARLHCLHLAMHRSHSTPGALALAASFFVLFAATASAAAPHATESLPDARILSAAPFVFHGDRHIFSRMSVEPSDSRIFMPVETIRNLSEPRLSQVSFKRTSTI
ncbi:hypothetical protein [Caballeronia sp. GAFFF3]|uniref:hypothetical protein n=1 Tax=Caballeronia sp. GAFFF3 TaxID=2921759 RepID=UPI0020290851|nr:hypothetical protein [Caballeronia sp. GAFFF3]